MSITPFVDWPPGLVLVLASRSPRRAELLHIAGIPFQTVVAEDAERNGADVAVSLQDRPPAYALHLAASKAAAVAQLMPGRLVLGADTVVVLDGEILQKPVDGADAARILGMLSGREHLVVTAVVLQGGPAKTPWKGWEETRVEFLPLSSAAIARYIATGEPQDKAGAYGIQGYGSLMIRRIEGCYFNVMGLPLAKLGLALQDLLSGNRFSDLKGRRKTDAGK
jgi:septum formation protein